MNGADAIVEILTELGVDNVFGYPGGTIMPVYDALLDSPVAHTLCRHEQGAGFAAIGYARATGQPGVCIATSGPGATNLITALADAMLDSIPVVAITGQVARDAMGTDAFQEIDMIGLSMACTKHSFLITTPESLVTTLHQAFALAAEGRPGPVLVDIPKDIQLAEQVGSLPRVDHTPRETTRAPTHSPWPAPDVQQAIKLLQQSQKPIAYVGGGVGMAGAVQELRDFLATSGIPCVCTLKGLGCAAPDAEGYLGMLGMHGTQAANLAVQESDLLLAIGARFDDRVTGKLAAFAPQAKVIHMDIDPCEFHKRRPAEVTLTHPLKQLLPALTMPLNINAWRRQCQALGEHYAWQYERAGDDIFAPLLLKKLSEQRPSNSIVSCDVGQHQMWVAQHMSFQHPGLHLSSGGLGTMGFGLPAAIGAAQGRPGQEVILVSGDGSFMMNVQELNTIRRQQLPVKIVLLDNQKLGMVRQWQELFFDGRYSETDLSDNPDFITLASAFGIPGRSISHKNEVDGALSEMLNAKTAWLLHVRIDAMANVWPLVPPGAANHQMMENAR